MPCLHACFSACHMMGPNNASSSIKLHSLDVWQRYQLATACGCSLGKPGSQCCGCAWDCYVNFESKRRVFEFEFVHAQARSCCRAPTARSRSVPSRQPSPRCMSCRTASTQSQPPSPAAAQALWPAQFLGNALPTSCPAAAAKSASSARVSPRLFLPAVFHQIFFIYLFKAVGLAAKPAEMHVRTSLSACKISF